MNDTAAAPILRRIWRLFLPHRTKLVIVAVAIVVSSVLGMVTPFLTRAVFDRALFPPGGIVDLRLLVVLCSAMVVIPLVTALIGVGQTYLTTRVGNGVMADLRERLFEHLERMELAFFTATKTGSIQSRLANDVGGVGTVLTSTASSILANSVTVIASLVAMLVLSWQLSIIALALMPVFIVIQRKVGRRRQRLAQRTQESLSDMTAITQEALSISGMLLSKIFNRADAELARYRTENGRLADLQVRQAMAGQGFFGIVGAFMSVTPAVVYLAEVMRGRTTLAIAHRLSTIRHADLIVVIDDGTVVERGRHQELLDQDGLCARLHAEQFGGGRIEAHFADGVMFTDGMVLSQRHGARA